MKNVPAMSTRESSAVLGCPVTLVALRAAGLVARAVVLATVMLPLPQASAELLALRQPCRGCSWKIWSRGWDVQPHPARPCRSLPAHPPRLTLASLEKVS